MRKFLRVKKRNYSLTRGCATRKACVTSPCCAVHPASGCCGCAGRQISRSSLCRSLRRTGVPPGWRGAAVFRPELPPADFPEGSMELLKSVLEAHEYQFKECIGSGGFSMVFRVHSLRYKSDFAAKVTNVKSARHRTASASYSNEHAALSRLNHPNIIRLYDSFDSGDYAFLILEYCQNGSIRDKISVSGLPEGPCRLMLRQLVDAVSHMHSCGIVHRDIKPSNVLLDSYGRPKLADFGLALCLKQGQFLHDHSGSLQYMAPEIMRKPCFDPFKADVWALGVTFHEMVLGALKWPRKKQQVESVVLSAGLMLTTVVPMQLAKVI